jgi:hypothetical protein
MQSNFVDKFGRRAGGYKKSLDTIPGKLLKAPIRR